MNDDRTESEGFAIAGHDIPDERVVASMKFDVLAATLAESKPDSARYTVIDREIKKRLAKDSAAIHLKNVLMGACAGGIFGLLGVMLGAYLKSEKQISPASAVQQVNQGQLAAQPQSTVVPSVPSVSSQPVSVPSPVKRDAQASQSRP